MKKQTGRSMLMRTLLKIDLFAEKPEIQIDNESSYPSINGLIVSIAIIIVISSYGLDKFQIMLNYEDTSFKEVTDSNSLDLNETFNHQQIEVDLAMSVGGYIDGEYTYDRAKWEDYVSL